MHFIYFTLFKKHYIFRVYFLYILLLIKLKNVKKGEKIMTKTKSGNCNFSSNALVILNKRYLKKDEKGEVIEKPEDMLLRVAENIAQAELIYDKNADIKKVTNKFFSVMENLEFLPNSPTLMNAGRKLQQLSACFVLPIKDSMADIFETVKNTALIHKSGGGTGFSFSQIRPKNDLVKSTKGVSSGPISFMNVFDAATETIKQGGTRRGANMGILRIDHPEIMDFITCKTKEGVLSNFNISIAITDSFMEALKNNENYDLINPRSKEAVGTLNAREVFDKIVNGAWSNGEPGIVFIDRINKYNPTPNAGEIESTNPCGEQPLLPYESCNLGSINLGLMTKKQDGKTVIDYPKLLKTVETSVHFLDNVIDMNKYPLPEIDKTTKSNRKIGLGVMGFADMLIDLGIQYNSEEAVKVAEEVMSFIDEKGKQFSIELAKKRGNFPNFEGSVYDKKGIPEIRNATVTTIAPTGTISMLAGASSGIEPHFSLVYKKTVLDGHDFFEVNSRFEKIAKEKKFYSQELMELISKSSSIKDIHGIPDDIKRVFVTSHDIEPLWHIKIQSAFQKYVDNAVSKTVNFANSATKEDVANVFLLAHELDCKGVTVYRDGSRQLQVIEVTDSNKKTSDSSDKVNLKPIKPRKRPDFTQGITEKIRTGCGNLYININSDEYGLCEVFARMGKSGGCAASNNEVIGRLISVAFRAGIEPESIISQLKGIRCPIPTWHEGEMVLSCADAIGKVIEKHTIGTTPKSEKNSDKISLDMGTPPECPECGSMLAMDSGCILCTNPSCGYSKC